MWLFFSRKGLALEKHCQSCILITNLFWKGSITMQSAQNIEKKFTFDLKMINVIDKKQIYDSVIVGKENASKEWNYIISMFLMSFNVYFVFGYACIMCICRKTAIWLCLGHDLAFFGENRLGTLVSSSTLKTFTWKLLKTGYVKVKRRKAVVSVYYMYVCEEKFRPEKPEIISISLMLACSILKSLFRCKSQLLYVMMKMDGVRFQ